MEIKAILIIAVLIGFTTTLISILYNATMEYLEYYDYIIDYNCINTTLVISMLLFLISICI